MNFDSSTQSTYRVGADSLWLLPLELASWPDPSFLFHLVLLNSSLTLVARQHLELPPVALAPLVAPAAPA